MTPFRPSSCCKDCQWHFSILWESAGFSLRESYVSWSKAVIRESSSSRQTRDRTNCVWPKIVHFVPFCFEVCPIYELTLGSNTYKSEISVTIESDETVVKVMRQWEQ